MKYKSSNILLCFWLYTENQVWKFYSYYYYYSHFWLLKAFKITSFSNFWYLNSNFSGLLPVRKGWVTSPCSMCQYLKEQLIPEFFFPIFSCFSKSEPRQDLARSGYKTIRELENLGILLNVDEPLEPISWKWWFQKKKARNLYPNPPKVLAIAKNSSKCD
jgi:hypothetical protein